MKNILEDHAVLVTAMCFAGVKIAGPGRFAWVHTITLVGTAAALAVALLRAAREQEN